MSFAFAHYVEGKECQTPKVHLEVRAVLAFCYLPEQRLHDLGKFLGLHHRKG